MKQISLITIALFASVLTLTAQTEKVEDYFWPKEKNKSVYEIPKANTVVTKYYLKNKQTGEKSILDGRQFEGKYTSIIGTTYKFTPNEVKITSTETTNLFETDVKRNFNPPTLFIKFPSGQNSATWDYKTSGGDEYICTSTIIQMEVDGIERKVLKVVRKIKNSSWGSTIELYAKGIGLIKEMALSDNTPILVMTHHLYDPEASK